MTGGPSSYSITGNRSLAAVTLFTGLRVAAFVNVANSTAATLNLSASGARTINVSNGRQIAANDLIARRSCSRFVCLRTTALTGGSSV